MVFSVFFSVSISEDIAGYTVQLVTFEKQPWTLAPEGMVKEADILNSFRLSHM